MRQQRNRQAEPFESERSTLLHAKKPPFRRARRPRLRRFPRQRNRAHYPQTTRVLSRTFIRSPELIPGRFPKLPDQGTNAESRRFPKDLRSDIPGFSASRYPNIPSSSYPTSRTFRHPDIQNIRTGAPLNLPGSKGSVSLSTPIPNTYLHSQVNRPPKKIGDTGPRLRSPTYIKK